MATRRIIETKRLTIPDAEAIIGKYYSVLDYGFVSLVDYMGGDLAVERAARVSYGAGTRKVNDTEKLLRYLYRHRHTSPFEMCELVFHIGLPIFVMRQLIRHRTACLTGDSVLHFDLPGGIKRRGNQLYKLTIEEVYNKFNSSRRNQYPVEDMNIRCLDEDNNMPSHTNITDIWQSGIKDVYRIELADGSFAKMSADHLCYTDKGWLKLKDAAELPNCNTHFWQSSCRFAAIGSGIDVGVKPIQPEFDDTNEEWCPVLDWEQYYEVSNQGRVRRVIGGKGSRSFGRYKKLTETGHNIVVSLNRPGAQVVEQVHQLVLEAFVGPKPFGMECCHKDGNFLNNHLYNLEWNTKAKNAQDRIRDGATTKLASRFLSVKSIIYAGREMTYDIEVAGPYHNFVCGGIVVHNSVNEYSGRYSVMPLMFYHPRREQVACQSKTNRQGRSGVVDQDCYNAFSLNATHRGEVVTDEYKWALGKDIARETARIGLPLSTYTFCYWKMDLRNLFHLIGLRSDPHAQWEIQQYSDVMAGMAQAVAPLSFKAFVDYQMGSVTFSQAEMNALRQLAHSGRLLPTGLPPNALKHLRESDNKLLADCGITGREADEFWVKLEPKQPRDFSLDNRITYPAAYYEKLMQDHAVGEDSP